MRVLLGLVLSLFLTSAMAKDSGQWENTDPSLRAWYQALRMPDNPAISCCGEADAYWCDVLSTEVKTGDDGKQYVRNFCAITDDRDDAPLKRPHVDIGTKIEIPPQKMKWGPNDPQNSTDIERNPTGHNVVFLSSGSFPYCFVLSGGV